MIKEQAKKIIKAWDKESKGIILTDAFLKKISSPTRENRGIIGDFQYGICYLRDDAVNALLQYIRLLENVQLRIGNKSLISKLEKEVEEDIKTAQELEDLFDL